MRVRRAHRGTLFPAVALFVAPTARLATPEAAVALCGLVAIRIVMANRLDAQPGWRLLAEVLLLVCGVESVRLGLGRTFALRPGGRLEPAAPEEAST
jgi:hypothetical protein